ncbi:MAG: histidinol dehydrogenase [Flavobacteriaceae bacterium]|nr:histidinol dehydrogenase [Flavobacteriaceae bacterium]
MEQIEYPSQSLWNTILARPTDSYDSLEPLVKEVFDEVATKGDKAVKQYTEQFDGVLIEDLQVPQKALDAAAEALSDELKKAMTQAKQNIEKFHRAQKTSKVELTTQAGVHCWQEKRPVEKVGLYIPGGSAPLFSTIMMLAIPAQIAGCQERILCTPPNEKGDVDPAILYAAQLCGITTVYRVGGIQAIAAMTLGTASIPKVYKIFGPGNQFVTAAKQWATKFQVAIDLPAGPSELLVAADATSNPNYVAADLLSQAEHGPDSQVVLVSTSSSLIEAVRKAIDIQLEQLPRKEIATQALENSKVILVASDAAAIDLINAYAPEHYIIMTENEQDYVDGVQNAGSVFIGAYTPESAGDYASGTNHTLPTNGYARQYSGVNLDSFMKAITFQKITDNGLQKLGPAIEIMATAEGLEAHKNAVSIRLKDLL